MGGSDFHAGRTAFWNNQSLTNAEGVGVLTGWLKVPRLKGSSVFVKWTNAATLTCYVDLSPVPDDAAPPTDWAWDPDDFYEQFTFSGVTQAAGVYLTLPAQMNDPFISCRFSAATSADVTGLYGIICGNVI